LSQALHLHFAELDGIDQFDVPVSTLLLWTFMRDHFDSGGLSALQHRLAYLHIERHQANHVNLLGDEVFEQFDLLRRIDVRGAYHRRIDAEILRAFLNPFFNGVKPRNARDLDYRDHFLLSLGKGKAWKAGAGHRRGTTDHFECLASI